MKRTTVLLHLFLTTTGLLEFGALFRFGDPQPFPSLYRTVHLSSLTVIVTLVYYAIAEAFRRLSPRAWGLRRREEDYERLDTPAEPVEPATPANAPLNGAVTAPLIEPDQPAPPPVRLTIHDLWRLVYGLGFVFFVTLYSLTGQQASCLYFFGLGLVCVCIDDALEPWRTGEARARTLELVSLGLAFSSLILFAHGTVVHGLFGLDPLSPTLFGGMCGVVLPFLAPLLMLSVKNQERLRTADMFELSEFAMPFMFILAAGFLFMDSTWEHGVKVIPGDILTILFVSPMLATSLLVIITTAVLRCHSIDPLLGVGLLAAARAFLDLGIYDPHCAAGGALVILALIARVASVQPPDAPVEPAV